MKIVTRVVCGMLVLLMLGCAAQTKKQTPANGAAKTGEATVAKADAVLTYDAMLKQGVDAVKAKKYEAGIAYFQQAHTLSPKEKEPLQRMAQTRFDLNEYGKAIVAAQEVLLIDPNDTLANSIVTVSGLRLAATALGVLRRENSISGSVKTEASGLAEVLRENLGVNELVPSTKKTKKVSVEPVTNKAPVGQANKPTNGQKQTGSESDPFGGLK